MKKTFVFFYIMVAPITMNAQDSSTNLKHIYQSAISHYYEGKPSTIVVRNTTINSEIVKTNYKEIADQYVSDIPPIGIDTRGMDSSWASTFRQAELAKYTLTNIRVPYFKAKDIRIIFSGEEGGIMKSQGDQITLSNVIVIENKAIVELGIIHGLLDGHGLIYFLEKKHNKWIVVSSMPTWNS